MTQQNNTNGAYLGSPDNPKTAGIVCYLTIFGWLIAYFALYRQSRDEVAGYHIRQTLLLHILSIMINAFGILSFWGMFPYLLMILLSVVLLVLWLIGLSGAISGVKKAVPLIGNVAQDLFSGL